jgi:peptidoglycan-associated lipoprotein
MTRSALSLVFVFAMSAGCAHEADKPVKTASDARSAEVPAARPPAPAPSAPEPVAAVPRSNAGDAIYFDFDSSLVRDDARPVLQKVGAELNHGSSASLKVEGNCDEVGTIEYNLALGEARARAAKEYLVHLGVSESRIAIASYGSQRPKYPGHDETAHARNRRDDLVLR